MAKINNILNSIANLKGFNNSKAKGDQGELAVIEILTQVKDEIEKNDGHKCAIWQSLEYPLAYNEQGERLPGNFELREDGLYESKKGTFGEIDVLFITPYRIFIIEVKTYNQYIIVDDYWTYKGSSPNSLAPNNWCNLCQVEKSARHMYVHLSQYIPDGDPEYIVPILCYAQGKLRVDTTDYTVTTLNGLKKEIFKFSALNNRIDVDNLIKTLSTSMKGKRIC